MKLSFAIGLTFLLAVKAQQCENQDIEPGCEDKLTPDGDEWYDNGGSVGGQQPNCEWYGSWPDRCQEDGSEHENFSMTACEACCVCGGGDEKKLCDDEPRWYIVSSSGVQRDCTWFQADDTRCDRHGDAEGRFEMSANEACCICGGGDPVPTRPPTDPPTSPPTNPPTPPPSEEPTYDPTPLPSEEPKLCLDEPRWYIVSSSGVQRDCTWFQADDTRCDRHGDAEGRFEMSANEACCICGGGDPVPTRPPTDPPTSPPTRATPPPSEEPKQCENESRWYVTSSSGTQRDCTWFDADDTRCDRHGDVEGRFEMSANDACCICGGGEWWA